MFALMEHLALYIVHYSFSDTLILSSDHKIFVTVHEPKTFKLLIYLAFVSQQTEKIKYFSSQLSDINTLQILSRQV